MPPPDILTPSPGDTSITILDTLFGPGWDAYITGGPVGGAGTVLFELLGALNTVVLAATSILIVYVMAVGVMGTAHEGEALGKRYSTLWTPLRSAFSIAMLAPIAGGLSIFQAILLALTWMGIGGADYLTTKAADFMADHGGQLVERPRASVDIYETVRGILYIETLQMYQVNKLGRRIGARYEVEWDGDNWLPVSMGGTTAGQWIWKFNGGDGLGMDAGDMGTVSVACADRTSAFCAARGQAMLRVIQRLYPVAKQIVSTERPDMPRVREIVAEYKVNRQAAILTLVAEGDTAYKKALTDLRDKMKNDGWVKLGQWYWALGNANERINSRINAPISYGAPNVERLATVSYGDLRGYIDRYRLWTLGYPLGDADVAAAVVDGGDGPMAAIREFASSVVTGGVDYMIDKMTEGGDPVAAMQDVGHYMIDAAWGMYLAATIVRAASEGIEKAAGAVGESLGKVPVIGGAAGKLLSGLVGVGKSMIKDGLNVASNTMIPLMIGGAALAFYLPSIPFILWTLAVIGWMIMVAESLVAAPLWIASHAIPEGEGLAGQHGKQGYMLFLGVLLRPALMVIGYFIASLGIHAIGAFIGASLKVFFAGMNAGHLSGLITGIALIFISGGLVIFAAHKVFSLITWLPDNVLRWIGQHVQSLGETHDERRIAGGVGMAMGRVEAPMARGMASGSGGSRPPGGGGEAAHAGGNGGGGGNTESELGKSEQEWLQEKERAHAPGDVGSR